MSDSISRQAAIEHLKKRLYETALNNDAEHPYYEEMADNRVSVWLGEVPTIEPVKHGKWVLDGNGYVLYKCTVCNSLCTVASGSVPEEQMYKAFKFCPNCGAKMERSEG